jgi:hypothetical protein
MAAPSFFAAAGGATDAGGAWSYTVAAGDGSQTMIVQILQDGTTNNALTFTGATFVVDLAGAAGWTQIPGPLVNGSWAVGASEEALQFLFIGRQSGGGNPTISGGNTTSEDLYINAYLFDNVSTGTTLATVIENGTAGNAVNSAGTSASAADSAVVTLGVDRLPLQFVAVNDDNTIAGLSSGFPTAYWQEVVAPYAESSGTDGAIAAHKWSAAASTAGTYGGSDTWGIVDSDAWGVVGFALLPVSGGGNTYTKAGYGKESG